MPPFMDIRGLTPEVGRLKCVWVPRAGGGLESVWVPDWESDQAQSEAAALMAEPFRKAG